jgi:RNA polymerase sigma-70 factor (ECF subfamily)
MATAIVSDDAIDADPHALHRLFHDTAPMLRSTLRRLTWRGADVDDMLQDVFVIALRRRDALLGADSPRSWLYGIALNVAAVRRRNHAIWTLLGLDKAGSLSDDRGPHEQLELAQAEVMLNAALPRISARKREVYVLYELDGLSGQEIARAVGCTLNTVWSRLHHARLELEQICRELARGSVEKGQKR